MTVRVRYAPSPTGLQHVGSVRSALFNYFFAWANNGVFILRVEDTDQTRTTDEALQDLYDTFAWLGVTWDEGPDKGGRCGPYVQSQRLGTYQEYARRLVASGRAYRCFCTEERLAEMRKRQEAEKLPIGYDRHCRSLTAAEAAALETAGRPSVVRLKVPTEGETAFRDILLGDIVTKNRDIPVDPVILKTDGFPTYHLANVVDDHLMEITHILRAQEWLPSVPIHMILYNAFGWTPPVFCHLPMVLGQDGQKLSKRHGSTAVREFRRGGYLPEAMLNYVTLLGWSYDGEREFFSRDELEKVFTLEKLNKAPAVFDYKKLEWFNGQYIRRMGDAELVKALTPYLEAAGLVSSPMSDRERRIAGGLAALVRERLRVLSDVVPLTRFLFADVSGFGPEELVPKKHDAAGAAALLRECRGIFQDVNARGDADTEELLRAAAERLGVKLGVLLHPVRVAITGSTASPPLIESMKLLGSDVALDRIDRALELLEKTHG